MAIDLKVIRDRVRLRIRDMDARKPSFVIPEIDQAIADSYLTLQARLPAPRLYTASAFTISGGGDTFTLPVSVTQWTGNDGGAEYQGDVRIRLRSTGQFLVRRTVEEVDSMREGTTASSQGLSKPRHFSLWEEKDQDVQGRCYPGASSDEACDLYAALSADDLRDFVGSGSDDLEEVEVQFSRIAANALVHYVAADLLERMVPDDLELRRINPRSAVTWRREAEVLLYKEEERRNQVAGIGRMQRWIG